MHSSIISCVLLLISFSLLPTARSIAAPKPTTVAEADQKFKAQLSESIQKTDQSIKLIRKQIIESQNAPFLPDLYVQLGDLLSQKAIALYYVKMENDAKIDTSGPTKIEEAQPVVVATREAIDVYKIVLHDFPTYAKRAEVSYKLAVCLKSIDDIPQFIGVASKIIKDFPNTDYSLRTSLLLGHHFLDTRDYDSAEQLIKPISLGKLTYEKNLAKYWLGLIYLGKEKYPDALHEFEEVIGDPDLKEQENPYDLKKTSSHSKTDLKREALIDSIRTYTYVYEKNPDPVGYYSKLSPTEVYFQEVIEKLAIRYVLLKKYDQSVKLLRTTSERTADPQKVINIYREVLLLMPLDQRLAIPAEEMSFVLHKFNLWRVYEQMSPKVDTDSYWFFEKQIRDVGTRNHDLAKTELNAEKRKIYLNQASDYYRLYLPFFDHTPNTVKMATDLADVDYLLGMYLESGEMYLRIFQGEFGPSPNRKALIENSILSLQKDKSEIFYEKVRAKGLLIKAIVQYQASSLALKNDPKLELLRLKTEYEQGFMPESITHLYEFAQKNRNTHQAIDAGDLIMDYYNTLNDFQGLQTWADKLLALKLPSPEFNSKLATIKTQAKSKIVAEKVKAISGYDEFSQGKSYLAAAMQSGDSDVKNAVLQEALVKSKREHDLATFLAAATLFAKKETNPQKRAAIRKSVAQENIKVGKFYTGIAELQEAAADSTLDAPTRQALVSDAMNMALLLHDPTAIQNVMANPTFAQVSSVVQGRVRDFLADAIDSPAEINADQIASVARVGLSEEALLSLFKNRDKLNVALRTRVDNEVKARCGALNRQALCLWNQVLMLEASRPRAIQLLRTARTDLTSLQSVAGQFMETSHRYQALEDGGDSHLETIVSIRGRELYLEFASYLNRVSNANPTLKNDLLVKVRESAASAEVYSQKCKTLMLQAATVNPAMKFCDAKTTPALATLMMWPRGMTTPAPHSDSTNATLDPLQKSVFSADTDPEPMLNLAAYHLQNKNYYHAAALANYGRNLYPNRAADFKTVLGCSLLKLGYLTETNFQLKTASDYKNLKGACLATLQKLRSP